MRIEILVEDEEPKFYLLNRPQISLGSHKSCDIVVANKGISRRHLVIITKDDKYFVADQSSTNGTYINEERLIPEKQVEFTSFFPIRIGLNTLVSLVSDEDTSKGSEDAHLNQKDIYSQNSNEDASTKMISLKDLSKGNTAGLIQKRTETIIKSKTIQKQVVKKNSNLNFFTSILIAILFVAGAYYQFFRSKKILPEVSNVSTSQKSVATQVIEDVRPIQKVELTEMPNAESILAVENNTKCMKTNIEKYVCTVFPKIFLENWGYSFN